MHSPLATLRAATSKDMPAICAMALAEGMAPLDTWTKSTVAVNSQGEVVGFIQVESGEDVSYVYPIVVYPTWRRYGVGRMLIEDAHDRCGELRLVSRGSSVPFYESLGFVECGWDEVSDGVDEGCADCPDAHSCRPKPMKLA